MGADIEKSSVLNLMDVGIGNVSRVTCHVRYTKNIRRNAELAEQRTEIESGTGSLKYTCYNTKDSNKEIIWLAKNRYS